MVKMMSATEQRGQATAPDSAYPYTRIWINGRTVKLDAIAGEREAPRSPFEANTFAFIRAWLAGQEIFTINTSGSTGEPKAINITRGQMTASARRTAQAISLEKNVTALICIDTRYIGGMMMLARCLSLGMEIVAVDPSANPLARVPVDKCVQFTAFVPYQIRAILESKHPHLLNNFEKLLIGGAPLGEQDTRSLERFQCVCYETYGMTETISHIALRPVNTEMKRPYFEALPGVALRQDDRGCLVVSADYLPEAVITNDLVEMIAPGRFVWTGRWDTVINTGGVKVVPERVEAAIGKHFRQHNFNHRFFIAAMPDEKLGSRVVLVLEGVQFSSELLNKIIAELRSSLHPYEVPRELHVTDRFAMTATEKIDRPQTLAGVSFNARLR